MLQLKLSQTNTIDETGKLVFLSDATGVYSVANPTGYGIPNIARNELAVFPVGVVVNSTGGKIPLVFTVYNPLTAVDWTATVKQDGWLQFKLVAVQAVASPLVADYNLGDFVFSTMDFKLYKVVTIEGVNAFEVSKPEDILQPTQSSLPFDQFFIANSSLLKINLNKQYVESLIKSENLSTTVISKRIRDQYNDVRSILQAALYQFCIGNKYQAAKFIEYLTTNNYGV